MPESIPARGIRFQAGRAALRLTAGPGASSSKRCPQIVESMPRASLFGRERTGAGLALGAMLIACEFSPRAAPEAGPLPAAALSELAPDSLRERRLADGAVYRYVWSARGPWAIHLVSAEVARCDLDLVVVPATGPDGATRVRSAVTRMMPAAPREALAGVNGDFFRLDNGAPLGAEVTERTTRLSTRPALAWDAEGTPWIGVPVPVGDGMAFGPDTLAPGAAHDGVQVVGGYPELLDGGSVVGDLAVTDRPSFAAARHPRTAVGFDSGRGRLWVVVVDGRQPPHSAGMTLPELANLFLWLGVDEALNLDGGGSSVMSLGAEVVSRPSDAQGERLVGNSVWLVEDPRGCGVGQPA